MEAKFVSSTVGSLVKNRPIKYCTVLYCDGESKFLITHVLDMSLGFDSDVHRPRSYVLWRTEDSRLIGEEKIQKRKEIHPEESLEKIEKV